MSQVRVAKGIPNQPLLKQTRFSNSLAKQKNTKKYLRPPKKIKNTKIQLNITKLWPCKKNVHYLYGGSPFDLWVLLQLCDLVVLVGGVRGILNGGIFFRRAGRWIGIWGRIRWWVWIAIFQGQWYVFSIRLLVTFGHQWAIHALDHNRLG